METHPTLTVDVIPTITPSPDGAVSDTRVTVTGIVTNTSADDVTLEEMTSNVFQWEITDTNDHSYLQPPAALQAPHFVTIRPGKAYIIWKHVATPADVHGVYNELPRDGITIVTDPVENAELRDNSVELADTYFEPAVTPDCDRELTASLTVHTGSGNECSGQVTFVPSELSVTKVDDVVPDDVIVDTDATLTCSP